jgi:hypothetical protein
MKPWLFVLALALLPGCDVATVALVMSGNDDSSSDDEAPAPLPHPGFQEPVSQVWIANIPDSTIADEEDFNIAAAGGNPLSVDDGGRWTKLGTDLLTTDTFDPAAAAGTFNAILIQTSSKMNFFLDSVEVLDANNLVVEYASGTTYFDQVISQDSILGPPDGISVETTATGSQRSFIFTIYTGPIEQFRINGSGTTEPVPPGDIKALGTFQSLLNVRPGGMAIHTDGLIHLTLTVGDTARLVRYFPDGTKNDEIEIFNDLATVGSHSVALNSTGVIFTAITTTNGAIQLKRYEPNLSNTAVAPFSSGLGGDRVEHNSIAVDSDGKVIIVGALNSLLSGRNHARLKIADTLSGADWQSTASIDSSSATYWNAVTTVGTDIFMTGDISSGLLGGTNQIYTSQFDASGVPTADNAYPAGESLPDVGRGIAVDATGNVYVCGSAQTATGGRNGILIRYRPGILPVLDVPYAGLSNQDDEFMDVVVDQATGAIYVVGYVTVAGQGENMVIKKYEYANNEFNGVWERTYHGGFGNDRAISVAISGNDLVVAGYETDQNLVTKLSLRIYEK